MTAGILALAGVSAAGLGGWALIGRRPASVPVIEADSHPLRVKPENAGGMQVVGADELVLGGLGEGTEKMAPSAEVPAPQALRAQMQQAAAPAGDTPIPSGSPVTSAIPSVTTAPVATMPADTVPRALRPGQAIGTLVQLAAVDTEAGAQAEWQRLAKRMPELLSDRRPTIQKAERDGHAVWRVRTGGFADVAEATGFCSRLRAKGGNCTLATF